MLPGSREMQVSGPVKEDTVIVPKIAAVERREGAGALARAPGCLPQKVPRIPSAVPALRLPQGRQQEGPGESPETGQDELTVRRQSLRGARTTAPDSNPHIQAQRSKTI